MIKISMHIFIIMLVAGDRLCYNLCKQAIREATICVVGCNTVSMIIPCHRVLGSDGALTGYAGGTKRKIWLLEHEGAMGINHNSK